MRDRARGQIGDVTGDLPDRVLSALADRYALEDVRDCRVLRAGTSVTVYRVMTGGRALVVREHTRPPDQVTRQHRLLRLLAAHGLPVAAPLPTDGGPDLLAAGDRVYALYPWIAGEHAPPADANAAGAAGEALARMHEATREFGGPAPNPRRAMRDRFLELATQLLPRLDAVLAEPALRDARDDAAWVGERVACLTRDLRDPFWERLPRAVIHGDLGPDNMLMRCDVLAGILDFDLATRDVRAADVAIAIQYLARSPAADDGLIRAAPARALLRGYEAVSRLSDAERTAVPRLVETKLARAPMRKLRQLARTPPEARDEMIEALERSTTRHRRLHLDDGWKAALRDR